MIYKNLGNTGLQVSSIGFGTWTNLDTPYQEMKQLISKCLDNGVNYFDLAESYGEGKMQTKFGNIISQLKVPREQLVISTKIWKSQNPEINSTGNTNRKHVVQGVKKSLQRLRMQYVDIVMAHFYDEQTPVEQICKVFNDVIEDGLAFYWGVSNWDAQQIFRAFQVCIKNKWHLPIATQNQYNMVCREQIQTQFYKLFQVYKFGLIAYSPLLGGYLTGKYIEKQQTTGRFSDPTTSNYSKDHLSLIYLSKLNLQNINQAILKIKQIAQKQLDCTLAQLAIAWVIKFKYASTALIGARNCSQLENTFKALDILKKLDDKIQGKINKILKNKPETSMQFKTNQNLPDLRPVQE